MPPQLDAEGKPVFGALKFKDWKTGQPRTRFRDAVVLFRFTDEMPSNRGNSLVAWRHACMVRGAHDHLLECAAGGHAHLAGLRRAARLVGRSVASGGVDGPRGAIRLPAVQEQEQEQEQEQGWGASLASGDSARATGCTALMMAAYSGCVPGM